MNQSAVKLWNEFKRKADISHDNYDVWAFGNSPEMADELLAYVLNGEKTGTSSLHLLYDLELEQEKLPKVRQYSVILDGNNQAQAVIGTKVVDVLPYNNISEVHAYLEGEGDRTLAYWRSVHQPFFEQELAEHQLSFSEEMLIVYELFKVVFRG
ncbi:ASCH domain-containing protein [Enterococcus sp. 5H]|uniref:ASCH domain-containing protein n=1 Tax=Enterococcus sp. 5H TaxID=1229490 RepID=UPI0023032923|nr:ASCH domain-containing protein [Enterococcus sp. 5H]MDA9470468.1 hypothetical protein [Enterococcus sp. 5H]